MERKREWEESVKWEGKREGRRNCKLGMKLKVEKCREEEEASQQVLEVRRGSREFIYVEDGCGRGRGKQEWDVGHGSGMWEVGWDVTVPTHLWLPRFAPLVDLNPLSPPQCMRLHQSSILQLHLFPRLYISVCSAAVTVHLHMQRHCNCTFPSVAPL